MMKCKKNTTQDECESMMQAILKNGIVDSMSFSENECGVHIQLELNDPFEDEWFNSVEDAIKAVYDKFGPRGGRNNG